MESFSPIWQEIAFFLIEHWGQSATTAAVTHRLSESDETLFRREMELDGSYFYTFDLTSEMADNLAVWIRNTLPSLWGKKEDLARIALLFYCKDDVHIQAEHARFSVLARQFPFPIVFVLEPEHSWKSWVEKNHYVFGLNHECLCDVHTNEVV